MLPSLLLNAFLPLAVYAILRPFVGSDLVALLIGVIIPIVVTLVKFVVRRRLDPIGVIAIAAFILLIAVLVLTGGNPLVLKLHEAIFTGPLGLIALVSAAIGRPLLGLIPPLRRSMRQRQLAVLTALVGGTLVLHCLVVLVLALALPTTEFLAIGRVGGIAVVFAGFLGIRAYRVHLRRAGLLVTP